MNGTSGHPTTTKAFTTSNVFPVTTNGEAGGSTTSSSSYTDFVNSTCEKYLEPSGYCSLLLQVELETQSPIVFQSELFAIFGEAWIIVANNASYGTSTLALYVEHLEFMVLNNRRLLMANIKSLGVASVNTTEGTVQTTATTTSSYNYYYNFSVALFDGDSCDSVSLWYEFFSATVGYFLNDYNDNILSESKSVTASIGFEATSILSATLSERNAAGSVIASTTFSTSTSTGNSYNGKHITFILGSLSIACFSWLL